MSQQGIFSIAPDSRGGNASASRPVNGGSNGSPFTAVSNASPQHSPFTSVNGDSPFQQTQRSQADEQGRGGIPQPRPEGQPPALGGGMAEAEAPTRASTGANIFEAVRNNAVHQDTAGGPFQMNGFPEQRGNQVMEAAPVAASHEASPFIAVQDARPDFEAAKAHLEPQQDFAAVPPRYTQEQAPPQQAQPMYSPQPAQQPVPQGQQAQPAAAAPAPTLTPVATAAMARSTGGGVGVAPAFQQLELRAIFGVDHLLDTYEILQRARTLPGIRNVAIVGANEATALSNFRQAMQGMGFGDSNAMKLNSSGGSVDFISEGETTIAVLLEGSYAPGVQETLIIVAREIGKLA
ncbi:MAG: hypothetical protein H7A51_01990 [Akkermansiaceae bacterium]|nr:hypothetical protein [Akkermansiaceae bacterium]